MRDLLSPWVCADTLDGRGLTVRIAQKGGGANVIVIAASGSGKGSILRQVGIVAACHPKALLLVNDCKGDEEGGAGVPELADAADAYGRTKEQWYAVEAMRVDIYSARAERYGKAKQQFWHPDKPVDGHCDPLVVGMTDEYRRFISLFPKFAEAERQMAAAQRSFGMQVTKATQRGGGEDFGGSTTGPGTAIRNDWRGNGTTFIGRAGDSVAAKVAAQDFGVDVAKLPPEQGWFFIDSKIDNVLSVMGRIRMIPTFEEVAYLGFEHPHGTVEDILTPDLVRPGVDQLHPQDRDIFERWRPEWEDKPAAPGDDTDSDETSLREVVEVVPGVSVEPARRLALVQSVTRKPTADELGADLLRSHDGPITRAEFANSLGISPGHASEVLARLVDAGVADKVDRVPGTRYPGYQARRVA